jgi:hypothetical protein
MMLNLQQILNLNVPLEGVCLVMDNARSPEFPETFKNRHRQGLELCCSAANYRVDNRWVCVRAMDNIPTMPCGGGLKATIPRSKSLDDIIFSCSSPPSSPISSCQKRKQINSTAPLRVCIRQASHDTIFKGEEPIYFWIDDKVAVEVHILAWRKSQNMNP